MSNLEEDPRYHSVLSRIYAILNDPEKAIYEAKIAMALYPTTKDALSADWYEMELAKVYAITGKHTMALDIIEKLLKGPSSHNWWDIKYNVIFIKVFDNNPRFHNMIEKDEERFRREVIIDISSYLP